MQSAQQAKEALLLALRARAIPIFSARPNPEDNLALFAARRQIFAALLNRITYLHIKSVPPESFYVGGPYVTDKRKVDCIIAANFIFPGTISPFEFRLHGARVFGYQHGNLLHIQVHRRISQQLWDDVRLRIPVKEKFIIAYLASCMPTINRRLLDNRYYEGHLLSRTFAIFEARVVSLSVNRRRMQLSWPVSFAAFPPSAVAAKTIRMRSIGHLIDAMDSYFTSDFDDCIRRIVNSAETFFEEHGWSATPLPNTLRRRLRKLLGLVVPENSNTFRRVLSDNVGRTKLSSRVINDNMHFIYTVRNRIVHNGFRMSTSSNLFCDKAIATLRYLIAGYCSDAAVSKYVDGLYMQFKMQCGEFGESYNLDVIERRQSRAAESGGPAINSAAAMSQFVYEALRFTERDKFSISR
jgi:hypothetical protein